MDIILGFDPGGERAFGWCLCGVEAENFYVLKTGTSDHTQAALKNSLTERPSGGVVVGAGIDAPMFWTADGGREADNWLRRSIGRCGAPNTSGTVQHFNSLRGACVIQGLLTARLLKNKFPGLPITEAHPKALLWLLGLGKKKSLPDKFMVPDLGTVSLDRSKLGSEHQRDAVLGAITAWAMNKKPSSWADLLEMERGPILAVEQPIGYWMPQPDGDV